MSDASDWLSRYEAEAARAPRLNASQEADLITAAASGDESARRILRVTNMRLVLSIARRAVHTTGVDLEPAVQAGDTGLQCAVEKFDHTKGLRFGTYAAWWIRQYVARSGGIWGSISTSEPNWN